MRRSGDGDDDEARDAWMHAAVVPRDERDASPPPMRRDVLRESLTSPTRRSLSPVQAAREALKAEASALFQGANTEAMEMKEFKQ